MNAADLSRIIGRVREGKPLIHHITNYVTVNDCANITLCIGAAPVMAHAREEVEEMVAMAGALVLNIGTPDPVQIDTMLAAGRRANALDIPVILDPVGAGATALRTQSANRLLSGLRVAVLKGNAGEIGVLAGTGGSVRGVDSQGVSGDPVAISRNLAELLDATVVMSGPVDIVTDGNRVLHVENGHPLMGEISGTGCMAASLTGACAAVSKDRVLSSAAALAAFGIAGERAAVHARGLYSFKTGLFDELAGLAPDDLTKLARVRSA
jgi:hydroxyethylthiazole kinase